MRPSGAAAAPSEGQRPPCHRTAAHPHPPRAPGTAARPGVDGHSSAGPGRQRRQPRASSPKRPEPAGADQWCASRAAAGRTQGQRARLTGWLELRRRSARGPTVRGGRVDPAPLAGARRHRRRHHVVERWNAQHAAARCGPAGAPPPAPRLGARGPAATAALSAWLLALPPSTRWQVTPRQRWQHTATVFLAVTTATTRDLSRHV